MSYKINILLIASVYFSSCKNENKFSSPHIKNQTEYIADIIPPFYFKVETDTILSNDYRVKIKYNSINKSVLKISQSNSSQIKKVLYREFESNLEVFNKNKSVLKKRITKKDFSTPTDTKFWGKAILQWVELDQVATQKNKKVVVLFSFFNPEKNENKFYNFFVDEYGNYEIKLSN